jgi:hypothetical protein
VTLKRYRDTGIPNPPNLLGDLEAADIEEEHAAGRKHDSHLVAPVSHESQVRVTRNREAAGVSMRFEKDPIRRVILALKATSVFLELLSESMWNWAELLEKSANKVRNQ